METTNAPTETITVVVGGRERMVRDLVGPVFVRALLSLAVGLAALVWPSSWLRGAALLFGGLAVVLGLVELFEALRRRRHHRLWGFEAVRGLVAVAAGGFLLGYPDATLELLAAVVGATWVVLGVLEVVQGIGQTRTLLGARRERDRWVRALRGAVVFALGCAVIVWPDVSLRVLTLVVGVLLVLNGLLLLLACRALRRAGRMQPERRLEVVTG